MFKELKVFTEFWDKFYRIYKDIVESSDPPDKLHHDFQHTRLLVQEKFRRIREAPALRGHLNGRISDSVENILRMDNPNILSDPARDRLKSDWAFSTKYLNDLAGMLGSDARHAKKSGRLPSLFGWVLNRAFLVVFIISVLVCAVYFLRIFFLK
ncbi:MAG: hypothetical protein ABH825_04555 [Candidatus Omnitrophota bacterium]